MTPVELRLQNFLSYGEAAPPLDFEAFSVACISGGNGQGKSSLLEAMTWALWGQARKGSSATKPDGDLIRKGAQRMVVEFTFDHEGQRYRVRRAYNVSSSGKTSRPELELSVLDDSAYRPLTGPSVAETQRILERMLRIDFDTFVNASFLLQGRSDEFTRKRPNERKEVLARILDLGRYEELEERARAREATARAALDAAERDLARIGADLSTRADIEAAREAARAAEQQARTQRTAAEVAHTAARRALDALDAEEHRAADLRARLARLEEDLDRCRSERADVDGRIEGAEALLARRAEIEAAMQHFRALETELRALTEKSAQFLGLRQQELALDAEIQRRRGEHERQRARLEADRQTDTQRLADLDAAGATRAVLVSEVAAATAQAAAFAGLEALRLERAALVETQRALTADLANARRALEADLARTAAHLADAQQRRRRRREVQALADTLRAGAQDLDTARQRLTELEQEGHQQNDVVRRFTLDRDHAASGMAALRVRLERLRVADEGTCPTCGTDLTPEHRTHVEDDLGEQIAEAVAAVARIGRDVAQAERTRDALRARYVEQRAQVARLAQDEEQFQRYNRELRDTEGVEAEAAEAQASHEAMHEALRLETFAPEVRVRLRDTAAALDARPFDAAAHERLRQEANRVESLAHRLADLDRRLGARAEVQTRLSGLDARLADLRAQHDDGRLFGDVLARRESLRAGITALGFDAARHEAVRQKYEALQGVPTDHAALLAAREQRADHLARRATLSEQLLRLDADRHELAAVLDTLRDLDDRRAHARALHDEADALRGAAVQAHEHSRDEVARLDLRVQQLAALAAHAADAEAAAGKAREEVALFRHLRTAFSRRGIPSLIIEETLPEIEEQANELLSRLTEGRMHLQLRTLRDKKAGGTAETLDIVLSDEHGGERPYEMFSGGEAFRINFALRVALSQLLARRSGVSVRTLVVDEGFGTQDPQGLQALVEAIRSVQDSFDKILVVTHLDELKEAFPVRIEVRKDPTLGSTFEVVGV